MSWFVLFYDLVQSWSSETLLINLCLFLIDVKIKISEERVTHLCVFILLAINSRLKMYTRECQKYQFLMFSYQQLLRQQSFGSRNT